MAEEMKSGKKAVKAIGTVLRIVITVIASVILGVNIYILNAKRLAGNQLPMPFGYGAAIVMSGSMSPALNVGDLVIVKEVSEEGGTLHEDLSVGDVVIFEDGDSFVIHRVIEKNESQETFTTKGDYNNAADAPVSFSQVKGVLVKKIRGAGDALLFMRNPVFIVFLIILVVLWTELSIAADRKKAEASADALRKEIEELKSQNEKNG